MLLSLSETTPETWISTFFFSFLSQSISKHLLCSVFTFLCLAMFFSNCYKKNFFLIVLRTIVNSATGVAITKKLSLNLLNYSLLFLLTKAKSISVLYLLVLHVTTIFSFF